MKAYVGVTDRNWYERLTAHAFEHSEVNFWFPSPRQGFAALRTGEPFIFKTHVSRSRPPLSNRIVGMGLFSSFVRMRLSEAWQWFGAENGVSSEDELVTASSATGESRSAHLPIPKSAPSSSTM